MRWGVRGIGVEGLRNGSGGWDMGADEKGAYRLLLVDRLDCERYSHYW